jgi:ribonuclease D
VEKLLITNYLIEKDFINSLETFVLNTEIVEISNAQDLSRALIEIGKYECVGFDTESRPAFLRGQHFPISIIQIALDKKIFIVYIQRTGYTPELINFFKSKTIKKIGIAMHDDFKKLNSDFVIKAQGLEDLSKIAKAKGILQGGARSLTARYLEKKLSKQMQTSNWSVYPLSKDQLAYAASDAWVCLKIYPLLLADTTDYHKLAEEHKELILKIKEEAELAKQLSESIVQENSGDDDEIKLI